MEHIHVSATNLHRFAEFASHSRGAKMEWHVGKRYILEIHASNRIRIRLGGNAHIFRTSFWLGEDVLCETKSTGFRKVAEQVMDLTEIII